MGSLKHLAMEQEGIRQVAEGVLEDTGHLEACPHGYLLSSGDDDLTDAYKVANQRISAGLIELPRTMKRRGFTDLIKEAYEDSPEVCPGCRSNESYDD